MENLGNISKNKWPFSMAKAFGVMQELGMHIPCSISQSPHWAKGQFTMYQGATQLYIYLHPDDLYKFIFTVWGLNEETIGICQDYAMERVKETIDKTHSEMREKHFNENIIRVLSRVELSVKSFAEEITYVKDAMSKLSKSFANCTGKDTDNMIY